MTTPLTQLLEEQKKEFDEQFKDSFSGGDMHSWERAEPIKDFITTAITKAWELALEEVEKRIQNQFEKIQEKDYDDDNWWLQELLSELKDSLIKEIAHLKETI